MAKSTLMGYAACAFHLNVVRPHSCATIPPFIVRQKLLLPLLPFPSMTALLSAQPALTIDPRAVAADPINPFIYGQFIEHLGRCIYGGIWAEMLEDRKFYFPITADYAPYKSLTETDYPVVGASPWQIVGDPTVVTMVKEDSFVGEQSPRLRAGAALRHHDLGVRAGLDYEGYVWVKALGETPATVTVTLDTTEGAATTATTTFSIPAGAHYVKRTFRLPAHTATDHATFTLRAEAGDLVIGTASLMPADNVNGLRRDTLALLKQLNGTIYRWPGGNFVSGYNWRDGIGDRDRRPPRKNPAWTGIEHNDFGTDEFIALCREIGAEPLIAANTGFGDAYSAAQWVEYCNSASTTTAGRWRAQNGSAAPFAVKYWCVGNEMFGPWQLGFMPIAHYTLKHNEVAAAMWAADPSLQLIGVGDLDRINAGHDPDQAKVGTGWSQRMLEACADAMNVISEHFYEGRLPWTTTGEVDLASHVGLLKTTIGHRAAGHRSLQASLPHLAGRIVPVSMDEWNYWHRDYVYGELGCIYDQADGLGVAAGLHEYFRQTDIIHMAFYAQTVNVIGAIKTSRTAAEMETTGLVLQLYRAHFGTQPITLDTTALPAPLDVAAALTHDRHTLTIGIVNPTTKNVELPLRLTARAPAGPATRYVIAARDRHAANAPGQPREVDLVTTPDVDANHPLTVPALGVALYTIPLR